MKMRGVALTVFGLLLPMQGGCLCGCGVASAREGRAGVVAPACREVSRRPPPTPPSEATGEKK